MPSSHFSQINEIVELIYLTKPTRLLDIGPGFGKYGLLAREYLELWIKPKEYGKRTVRIDAIEAYENYITNVHQNIYDNIYIGDAIEILPRLKNKYDLALLIDVLEHQTPENGRKLLSQCAAQARNMIISTPKKVKEQEDTFGNPFERHRSQWKKNDLAEHGKMFFVPNPISIICYLGVNATEIQREFKKSRIKRELRLHFPFLPKFFIRLITSLSG